jgi:RNA polymerase sigma factor (sigma-70 family)
MGQFLFSGYFIIAIIKRGASKQELNEIILTKFPQIKKIAQRYSANAEEVGDYVQMSVAKVVEGLASYNPKEQFSNFVHRNTINVITKSIADREKEEEAISQHCSLYRKEIPTPEDTLVAKEHNLRVWLAMNSLEEQELSILFDRLGTFSKRKTLECIGEEKGLTRERVRLIERKAIKTVQRRVERWEG